MPVHDVLAFTNISEEPAAYPSPISTEDLPQFAQPAASDALWFANFPIKSSFTFEDCIPPESKQSIIISATYI